MKKRTVAVIGAGWWGSKIIRTLASFPEIQRLVCYDARAEPLQRHQEECGVEIAPSYEAVLENASIDTVCIATPTATHYEYSKKALLCGKHVFVEKLPASTPEQVAELGLLAQQRRLVYMLDALYLFLDPVQKLKQLFDSGFFKRILYVHFTRFGDELRRPGSGLERIQNVMYANGTDVIDDLFFHDAGLMLHLCGPNVRLVNVEALALYHPSIVGTAFIRYQAASYPIRIELSWSMVGRRWGIVVYDEEKIVEFDGYDAERPLSIFWLRERRQEHIPCASGLPLTAILRAFLQCLDAQQEYIPNADFMRRLMQMKQEVSSFHDYHANSL